MAADPRKPRKFNPAKIKAYTVHSVCLSLMVARVPEHYIVDVALYYHGIMQLALYTSAE